MTGSQPSQVIDVLRNRGISSPDLFVQKLDFIQHINFVLPVSRALYRQSSFLDDRILPSAGEGAWIQTRDIEILVNRLTNLRPLHFIFHCGHVGSTLLSRLLEAVGNTLALREPPVMRALAEAKDKLGDPGSLLTEAQYGAYLSMQLRLWQRGYEDTARVIVKATSSVTRIGVDLLALSPQSQAVVLTLDAEPFLAAVLAGSNSMIDLRGQGPERMHRIARFLGEAPVLTRLSAGELTAATWLAEKLSQIELAKQFGGRVLTVDFDELLSNLEARLAAVLGHFVFADARVLAAQLSRHELLGKYSKALDQPFSPDLRRQLLAQTRSEHGGEIAKGMRFIEDWGRRHERVARILR